MNLWKYDILEEKKAFVFGYKIRERLSKSLG